MNRNDSEVELLPSPAAIVRARSGIDKAELDRLVQEKVAEIMAERDAFAFEPFFRSRQIAYELKRLQTIPEQRKWTVYFDRHGCLICQTRKLIHIGNGMCGNCYPRIFRELKQIIAEGLTGETARPGAGTSRAQRLLPPNGPQDGMNLHRCWYRRSNETEKILYSRVAQRSRPRARHVCGPRSETFGPRLSCAQKRGRAAFKGGDSMRVAIYGRVSTVNHGQDVGLQTRELRQFAEARAWTVAGEYLDAGVSGAKDSRPELNRLMVDAHKRRFDVVCVWRFDRFARSVSHLLRALETFKALGIEFVSFSEQMDTSTPAGKMVFTVLGAVAELERSLIVERVRAGLRNARAKGKTLGRPRVLVDRCRIAKLREEGLSWAKIAVRLGVGEGTVYRAALESAKNHSGSADTTRLQSAAD